MAQGMVREILNIYYLLDTSAGMSGARIQQLNTCMQELKPALEEASIDNNVEVVLRVIEFGNDGVARWHIGSPSNGVLIEDYVWVNLQANGWCTPTAKALELVTAALSSEYLGNRALRPVVVLVTDGASTDDKIAFTAACNALKRKINGNTTRIAVGIADADRTELEEFASRGTIRDEDDKPFVFETDNAETLGELIRWASVVSIKTRTEN